MHDKEKKQANDTKAKNFNGKRSSTISMLSRKNHKMSEQIKVYLAHNRNLTAEKREFLIKLFNNINSCAYYSLYRDVIDNNKEQVTYIGSHTCKNKNCNICNYYRQKAVRRKYLKFFKDNEEIVSIRNNKTGKEKRVTKDWYYRKFENNENYTFIGLRKYDLMHLTLTVPHTIEGFRGNKFYFQSIIERFNVLRKYRDFQEFVYGGEYGVETTANENGLHIHIHALLFVKKTTANRNKLHEIVLKHWNNLTSEDKEKDYLSDFRINKIIESNKHLNREFVGKLHASGSTMIGLKTIFSLQSGEEVRSSEFNSDAMRKAVLETISYHFKPQAFDPEYGVFDISLIAEILPHIYKKQLYNKFGCLEQEKSLNINSNSDFSEEYEDLSEFLDIDTGELTADVLHYVTQPYKVYHDADKDNEIKLSKKTKKESIKLETYSTAHAVGLMSNLIKSKYSR